MIEIEDVEVRAENHSADIRAALAVLPQGKSFKCKKSMRAFVFREAKLLGIRVVTQIVRDELDTIRVGRVEGGSVEKNAIDYLK